DPVRRIYGLQFHPEVTHSEHGMQMLDNFLTLCGAARDWTMDQYIEQVKQRVQKQTAGRKVCLLVSGGVDSSVAFLLLNQALGEDRVLGLHIDNGFMRKGETALVERLMKDSGFHNLQVVDASADFLRALEGVAEPEEKRRLIGEEFLLVRDRALARLELDPDEWLLGQGTLYTDTIESGGTDNAAVIKTHHNRVGVIEELLAEGKVVEPLDQLYKDEARELGEKLGLPHHLVWRHPFPGPGLGVRALCSDGDERIISLETAQSEAQEMAGKCGLDLEILPLRSVGVQGDSRTYAHPAVVSGDSDWATLEELSTELTNSFTSINRVIYLLGPQERPTQGIKKGYLTRDRLDL
ncbi:MAG: glutamine-hydrolyzing GMP synthase, partial [Verrucomicrobiota bacterium]|nr:glutamine-hydrolyzing GMP synthase [Verrucomicrobiota bacterium]